MIATFLTWPSAVVLYTVAGAISSLIVGTTLRLLSLRNAAGDFRAKRLGSLRSWWTIVLLMSTALLLGVPGIVLLFAAISALAIREFMQMTKVPYGEFRLLPLTLLLVGLHYLWIYLGWREVFLAFLPVAGVLLVGVQMVLRERAKDYLVTAASLHWGLLLTTYLLSHAPLLATLPASSNPVAGSVGWLLYLLLLTGFSDISQALIGRRWGKRPIAPVLSPNKTRLGLVGGVLVTVVLATALAPLLTPLSDPTWRAGSLATLDAAVPWWPAILAGLLIGVVGYFGDLTMSGVKRDLNVKDSGTVLPGQGGILDRIDSLTFTAPAFYYYVILLGGG